MIPGNTIDKFHERNQHHENIECLDKHLSKIFSSNEITVFHEIVSLDFHLDVYFINAANRNYNILLTSGMSLLEMSVASHIQDRHDYLFAELMVLVPKTMEFGVLHTGTGKNDWIISMLKQTARFPHHYNTFLSTGHTLQATEDMQTYDAETKFVGCVLLPSVTFDDEFTEITCGNHKINIYSLFPLYKNELEYKVQNGYAGFVDLLNKEKPKEIIDNERKNLISRKGFLRNLFGK